MAQNDAMRWGALRRTKTSVSESRTWTSWMVIKPFDLRGACAVAISLERRDRLILGECDLEFAARLDGGADVWRRNEGVKAKTC